MTVQKGYDRQEKSIPALDVPMEKLAAMSYQEVAYEVMSRFLTDFTEDELKNCIANAYAA